MAGGETISTVSNSELSSKRQDSSFPPKRIFTELQTKLRTIKSRAVLGQGPLPILAGRGLLWHFVKRCEFGALIFLILQTCSMINQFWVVPRKTVFLEV